MSTNQIIHTSARGKIVDMNKLIQQNEMTLAVGNARVNARGDEIGPGGKIIQRQSDYVPGTDTPAQGHSIPVSAPPVATPAQAAISSPPKAVKLPKIQEKDVSGMDPEGNE